MTLLLVWHEAAKSVRAGLSRDMLVLRRLRLAWVHKYVWVEEKRLSNLFAKAGVISIGEFVEKRWEDGGETVACHCWGEWPCGKQSCEIVAAWRKGTRADSESS